MKIKTIIPIILIISLLTLVAFTLPKTNDGIKTHDINIVRNQIIEKYGSNGMGTGYIYNPTNTFSLPNKFPSDIYRDALVLSDYNYAKANYLTLEQMPCYCSCGEHSGHKSLRDCYINDDGSYNTHASFCDICLGEVATVQNNLEV